MKVYNMLSSKGNKVANQFIIEGKEYYHSTGVSWERDIKVFQSYDSVICKIYYACGEQIVQLDTKYWNFSKTTSKYLNQFLGETGKETQEKIDTDEYVLMNLN